MYKTIEKKREYDRKYRLEHPEKKREYDRRYASTHKESIFKKRKEYIKKQNILANLRCRECNKLLEYRNKSGYCSHCLIVMLNKSLERRNKLSQRIGEKNPAYKGGHSRNHHCGIEYGKWRTSIFERDDYTCQICGQRGGKLEVHHKFSWRIFPEFRYKLWNGITLCKECHYKITSQQRSCKHSELVMYQVCGECGKITELSDEDIIKLSSVPKRIENTITSAEFVRAGN